jgi:signal transduction histidine kinase/CheY-like chemotaxis protein
VSSDERILPRQVELVFQLMPRNLLASLAASTMVAILFRNEKGPVAMLAWWLALSLVTAARYQQVRLHRRQQPVAALAPLWARRATVTSCFAGILWGVAITFLAPPWGTGKYVLAVFMVAGIPAAALAASVAVYSVYFAFLLPILVPYAIRLLFGSGSLEETFGGLAALVYCATLAGIGKIASGRIAEGLALRLENADLVERLSSANEELRGEVARRSEIEGVLRHAKEAAEAASVTKSRFLAKMSHELRTPMNGVLGMAELLLATELTEQQRRFARRVEEEGQSLLQIIDDILDVSQVEAGRLRLKSSDFNLRHEIERAVALHTQKAVDKGVGLSWRIGEKVPERVHGDPGRLRQVLVNLVSNALKFTEAGSVTIDVDLADDGDPYHLRFRVRDTGVGIPEALQGRLFEPFVQGDESAARKVGGTGLGLSICRQLVSLMGGVIELESSPGRGSLFRFDLRLSEPAETRERRRSGDALGRRIGPGALAGSVLLVEDSEVNREVALAHLASLGLTVRVAEHGEAAVEALSAGRHDVVLMDCEMPGMDGYEATRAIRAAEAASSRQPVPIIALTASAMEEDRKRALDSGMNDFLSKPFTRAQLHGTLARWLPKA